MNSGFGDKEKLRDALQLAASFRKGGKAGDAPMLPRMNRSTFSPREPPPPPGINASQQPGTPSVRNRIYSNAGSFSTGLQKTATPTLRAFDSSGKDFLMRKDVPKLSQQNDAISKPQSKDKQTPGPGDAPIQSPKERPPQKMESDEGSGGIYTTEPRPHQSTDTSALPGTGPKDSAATKPNNPGLDSFLSFVPPGAFNNASTTTSRPDKTYNPILKAPTSTLAPAPVISKQDSRPDKAENPIVKAPTSTLASALVNSKQNSCPSKVTPDEAIKSPEPVAEGEFASAKPFDRGLKEMPPPGSTSKMLEVAKPVGGNQSPLPEVRIASAAPETKFGVVRETATETGKAKAETPKPSSIVELVLKQEEEPTAPLKPLPNGAIKEKPLSGKTPESPQLRPQARDFSPNFSAPSDFSRAIDQFLAPRLINSIQPTLPGVENLQQFIPTGITTGQLVTTTEVSISGGTMTPGECRGTLYMQTPVSIHRTSPQSLGNFIPIAKESSQQDRPSNSTSQRKPTKGLAASRWAK